MSGQKDDKRICQEILLFYPVNVKSYYSVLYYKGVTENSAVILNQWWIEVSTLKCIFEAFHQD